MKRKALLSTTGCSSKLLENWTARDLSPVVIGDGNWNEYHQDDGIKLRLMVLATQGTDLRNASKLAVEALHKLYPMHPLYHTGVELWCALVQYDWPDAPEDWDCRAVVAGRWADLGTKAQDLVTHDFPGASVTSVYAVSLSKAADDWWNAANELGLPEVETLIGPPVDLSGFPDWFVETELARRALVFGNGSAR